MKQYEVICVCHFWCLKWDEYFVTVDGAKSRQELGTSSDVIAVNSLCLDNLDTL